MVSRIIILLLTLSIYAGAQDTTRYIFNPQTGRPDYISRYTPANDSTINFGSNNTVSSDTANGAIGHNNTVDAPLSMAFGYSNTTARANNILFGIYTRADSSNTITIGRGLNGGIQMNNTRYGSIGLGMFASEPLMYIQSGYEFGETYSDDIGGVSIGGKALDTLTALQINAHLTGSAYFLKCKTYAGTDVFSVDYDGNAELAGILTVDSVVCTHVPTIHQAAGDTSNYHTPDKIGDLFIDTSAGDTYISVGSSRGDWEKLNGIWPLVAMVVIRRRRR